MLPVSVFVIFVVFRKTQDFLFIGNMAVDGCCRAVRLALAILLVGGVVFSGDHSRHLAHGQQLYKKSPRAGPSGAMMSPAWQLLMKDAGYEGGSETPTNPRYDDLVALADSLSKVRALGDFFSHRGRPRYVNSIRSRTL